MPEQVQRPTTTEAKLIQMNDSENIFNHEGLASQRFLSKELMERRVNPVYNSMISHPGNLGRFGMPKYAEEQKGQVVVMDMSTSLPGNIN